MAIAPLRRRSLASAWSWPKHSARRSAPACRRRHVAPTSRVLARRCTAISTIRCRRRERRCVACGRRECGRHERSGWLPYMRASGSSARRRLAQHGDLSVRLEIGLVHLVERRHVIRWRRLRLGPSLVEARRRRGRSTNAFVDCRKLSAASPAVALTGR